MKLHKNMMIDTTTSNISEEVILELDSVCKYFDNCTNKSTVGVENINLKLHANEVIAILGKSGSGKSTLLRILSGLIEPTQGHVYYRNEKITKPLKETKMVFQNYALLPWMTVAENIAFGLNVKNIHPLQKEKCVQKAMRMIGIQEFETAYPSQLSGGMCQRVGFARALVTRA